MELQNFQLGRDGILLEWQSHYLDLHNCFGFERLTYNLPLKQLEAGCARLKNGRKELYCRV